MAPKQIRPIRVEGNIAYIPLTNGYEALVDANDVHLVEGYNWCSRIHRRKDGSIRNIYAQRSVQKLGVARNVWMHREILAAPEGLEVDHRNGNGIDNTRSHLRAATRGQNRCNCGASSRSKSGIKGVHFDDKRQKWVVSIALDGKSRTVGRFVFLADASAAYAKASAEMHGEFGRTA